MMLLIGILIGVALGALTWLILTGRLRFHRGHPPAESRKRVVTTELTGRRFTATSEEEARRIADSLSPEAAEALDEALRTGRATRRIVVNVDGEERIYDSLEDVPAEVREQLERLRRGVGSEITITVDGVTRTFGSRDEVPPELRRFLPPERS